MSKERNFHLLKSQFSGNRKVFPENALLRRTLLLTMIVVGAVWYFDVRLRKPNESLVNGTYHNDYFGDVLMQNGGILFKNKTYKYDLEDMKFGRTAYVQGDFSEDGFDNSSDQTSLIFFRKNGKDGFDTAVKGREYIFLKVK